MKPPPTPTYQPLISRLVKHVQNRIGLGPVDVYRAVQEMSGAAFKRKPHSHPRIPAKIHHPLEPGEFPFAV
eukprot:2739824-Pyramimonas_sp.AAC.1